MEKRNEPEHVVVSGGSRGLGLALVRGLLEHGYLVSTFSRRETPELDCLRQRHPESLHVDALDIADRAAVARFIKGASSKHGRVWALVNNSAVAVDGVLATLPEVEIAKMLQINLDGALRLARLCIRDMLVAARGGRILNISSIVGSRGFSGLSVYSATKAALEGMSRSLARELGSRGITVNAVAPGYMLSDLSAGLQDGQLEQIRRRTPLERLGTPADVLPLVRFLLSPAAGFITGETIRVDGGASV